MSPVRDRVKFLILGAQGALGGEFSRLLAAQKPVCWDRQDLDVTDPANVAARIGELSPEVVINCAAYNAVDKAEQEPKVANQINGEAVGFIARASKAAGATLVHFSTAYVFDGSNPSGYNEDDRPSPISAYGQSKLRGEEELRDGCRQYYLIRTDRLFGGQGIGKKSFVNLIVDRAQQGGLIEAVNDEFGNPTFVKDLAQATLVLVEQQQPFGIYHLVNSGQASWYEWAQEILKAQQSKATLAPISSQAADERWHRLARRPKYGTLNNTKFLQLRPWQEALREYLNL